MHARRRRRSRMQHATSITSPSRHPFLATLPRLHPLRLHVPCDEAILTSIASPLVVESPAASSVDHRSPPMLRFHSSALVDCRWAVVQGRPLPLLALLCLAHRRPRPLLPSFHPPVESGDDHINSDAPIPPPELIVNLTVNTGNNASTDTSGDEGGDAGGEDGREYGL